MVLLIGIWQLPHDDEPAFQDRATGGADLVLPRDEAESDEAWAAVRAAAENVALEDVHEAGITARPGSAEGAMTALTDQERERLLVLLEEELKRPGI